MRLRLSANTFDEFPFLAYAATFWYYHWQGQLSLERQQTINRLIRRILDPEENPTAYINYINITRPSVSRYVSTGASSFWLSSEAKSLDSVPQPLYDAARIGHWQLCEWLVSTRACDVDAVGGPLGQAIQAAARFGHKEVVEFLLDHGANTNQVCGKYGTLLQAAA